MILNDLLTYEVKMTDGRRWFQDFTILYQSACCVYQEQCIITKYNIDIATCNREKQDYKWCTNNAVLAGKVIPLQSFNITFKSVPNSLTLLSLYILMSVSFLLVHLLVHFGVPSNALFCIFYKLIFFNEIVFKSFLFLVLLTNSILEY